MNNSKFICKLRTSTNRLAEGERRNKKPWRKAFYQSNNVFFIFQGHRLRDKTAESR